MVGAATLRNTRAALRGPAGNLVLGAAVLAILGWLLIPRLISGPGYFLQTFIYGLDDGAIFALISLGYTMVYGIIELINFAHGDIFGLSTFIALSLIGAFGLAEGKSSGIGVYAVLVLVGLISMFITGVINVGIERVAYRPLRNAPRLAPLITAVGMSFILEGVMYLWQGASPVHFPSLLPDGGINLGTNATLGIKDMVVIMTALILVVVLTAFINGTKLGKAMRATSQDREAARLMGIDINRTIAATFFIGAALAAGGGLVFGLYFNTVRFDLGFRTGLYAFTAAVFGGIGNIQGAALGGLFIGLVQAFSNSYFQPALTDIWVFLILILVLVFRPTGLLGMQVPER